MEKLKSQTLFAARAIIALCLLLISFAPRPGGYTYKLHLNNKLVSEHYLTSKFEAPTVTLSNLDIKGTLGVYFNECGQIGRGRKLSLRTSDQKILKEWSFTNSTAQNDAMEVALNDVSGILASAKVAVYYTSERVTKPQVLAYLIIATTAKSKATSR